MHAGDTSGEVCRGRTGKSDENYLLSFFSSLLFYRTSINNGSNNNLVGSRYFLLDESARYDWGGGSSPSLRSSNSPDKAKLLMQKFLIRKVLRHLRPKRINTTFRRRSFEVWSEGATVFALGSCFSRPLLRSSGSAFQPSHVCVSL